MIDADLPSAESGSGRHGAGRSLAYHVLLCTASLVMLYPLPRLGPRESQILYDGPPEGLDAYPDPRVRQFVRGEAGERLREMAQLRHNGAAAPEVRAAQCQDRKHEIGHE